MQTGILRKALAAFALGCLTAGAAFAQAEPDATSQLLSPTVCDAVDESREAEDQSVVEAAMAAGNRGGHAALEPHLAPLRAVLERAPSCFPAIELRGDRLISRVDLSPSMTLLALTGAAARGRNMSLVEGMNIYPTAAFLLGSYDVEFQRYEEALVWLDRGLALQPHDEFLAVEKATALATLRRPSEAVALLQSVLDDPLAAEVSDRARLLRNLGVSLIDLSRLEEAEAALNELIRLQPNNPRARAELLYIAQLRSGAPPQPILPPRPAAGTKPN